MLRFFQAFAVGVMLLSLGQGCPGPQSAQPPFDKLAVNDSLRSACQAWQISDPDIKALGSVRIWNWEKMRC